MLLKEIRVYWPAKNEYTQTKISLKISNKLARKFKKEVAEGIAKNRECWSIDCNGHVCIYVDTVTLCSIINSSTAYEQIVKIIVDTGERGDIEKLFRPVKPHFVTPVNVFNNFSMNAIERDARAQILWELL